MKIVKVILLIFVIQSCNNDKIISEQEKVVNIEEKEIKGLNLDSVLFCLNTHFDQDNVIIRINDTTYFSDTISTHYSIGVANCVWITRETLMQGSIVEVIVNDQINYIKYKYYFDSIYHFNYSDNKVELTYGSVDQRID